MGVFLKILGSFTSDHWVYRYVRCVQIVESRGGIGVVEVTPMAAPVQAVHLRHTTGSVGM